MKTFPSYDYTLCRGIECKSKDKCVRHLTYIKSKEDKKSNLITLLVNKPTNKCDLYVDSEQYEKRFK